MEVRVGHVVVPCSATVAAPNTSAAAGTPNREAHESVRKRQRLEGAADDQAVPADVVVVPVLTTEALREALRQYALQALRNMRDGSLSKAAVAATQEWCRVSPAEWPVVVAPPFLSHRHQQRSEHQQSVPPPATTWETWSFCFVPQVLRNADGAVEQTTHDAATPHVQAVLAAIALPRGVCVVQGSEASPRGCVTAVLCEHIDVPLTVPADVTVPSPSSPAHALPAALTSQPLLLVGAGGIGCEALKVLVLCGFTNIHVIDLDTIDATNLNRQFLFQLPDVGHSKAETARRVVLEWFTHRQITGRDDQNEERGTAAFARDGASMPNIVASHDNIKADIFDDAFYRRFAVVLNALDNVSARQHVNRLCMRNAIPLIESGTMGYNGQVQPIVKGVYECYDCRPKPPDTKTFAVCTIHARPTTMVHCVHYAKELYEVLFGSTSAAGDEASTSTTSAAGAEKERAEVDGVSGDHQHQQQQHNQHDHHQQQHAGGGGELSYLRSMVSAWRHQLSLPITTTTTTTTSASSSASSERAQGPPAHLGAQLLRHLFVEKVQELLAMKSAWSSEPPVPLEAAVVQRSIYHHHHHHHHHNSSSETQRRLSTEEVLPLPDCMELFLRAVDDCLSRAPGLAFRKEDDAAVRFVSATANLRAGVFHIAQQSLEEVRSIAGSIVPAIATTNAIIAAAVVHELVTLLRASPSRAGGAEERRAAAAEGEEAAVLPSGAQAPCVVYARRAPQTRRRRLPFITGPHALSPSLFTEVGTREGVQHAVDRFAGETRAPSQRQTTQQGKPHSVVDAYLVHSTCPNPPNALHCVVCQDVHPEVIVQLRLSTVTLGQLVHHVLEEAVSLEGPCLCHGTTLLYEDEDYESLAACTLAELLCPPSTSSSDTAAAVAAVQRPHRFVLTVDALNTDIAWNIVLLDAAAAAPAQPLRSAAPADGAGGAIAYELSGLEAAREAERRAVARLAEQRNRDGDAARSDTAADGAGAVTTAGGAEVAASTAEVIISDDDGGDDVCEVPVMAEAGPVPAAVEDGAEVDDVFVVD